VRLIEIRIKKTKSSSALLLTKDLALNTMPLKEFNVPFPVDIYHWHGDSHHAKKKNLVFFFLT
jgi:hypothetical protein